MSASDNLEAIWAAPFGDALDALGALMAQHGRVFLIGAGCSKCAGLPLMEELTAKVLDSGELDAGTTDILKGIRTASLARAVPTLRTTLVKLLTCWLSPREELSEAQPITRYLSKTSSIPDSN